LFQAVKDPMPVSLLIVGQTGRAEAGPFADWLRATLTPATIRAFRELTTALREIAADSWIPDLVVVIQSWPDEFSPDDVDRLLNFAPLARYAVCCGDWCESDGHNRAIWPLAARIPLRSAQARIEREWQLLNNKPGAVPLPLSASRDEIFAVDHPPLNGSIHRGSVTVDSPDSAYRRYLVQLVSQAGDTSQTANEADVTSLHSVVLFDADPWNDRRRETLMQLRAQAPASRIIALQSLPDANAAELLRRSGADALLPKLGDQQRLLDAVRFAENEALARG
jgi:hypothetical protein